MRLTSFGLEMVKLMFIGKCFTEQGCLQLPFLSLLFFFFLCALHLPSGKFGLSYLGKATAAARAALPIANSVCGILGSKQSQCLGSLTCTQMLMYVIAHGGCMDTIRESANAWDL